MKHTFRPHRGVVTSVRAHHTHPKYAVVEVAHGPRPKAKKKGEMPYDDRPASSIVMSHRKAAKYRMGHTVGVDAMHMNDDDGDDEMDPMDAYAKKVFGKKKGAK